jgi:hypothetical protein
VQPDESAPVPAPAFDAALARGATRRVPVSAVVDPLPVTHAADRVAEFRAAMRAGARFPPIGVLPLAGRWLVADGHKRFAAWRELGHREIDVEVWTLGRWLADQVRQVGGTGRRLGRAARLAFVRPAESWALLAAAPRHWWRVARSLGTHAAALVTGSRRRA